MTRPPTLTVSELIAALQSLPADLEVHISTPSAKYPEDIGMDDLWELPEQELSAGTKAVLLVAVKAKIRGGTEVRK